MGLEEALVVSFDQRSPHMFEVALEPSIQERSSAISSALGAVSYTHLTLPTICSV